MTQWKALTIEHLPKNTPLLYVNGAFTDSSYTVFVTDLVYLWVEQLDRRAIMRRAMNEDTTIDPTNGPDQLKTLLEHLSSCLEGKPGTSIVLKSSSGHQQLNLMLTSKLPPPLAPLLWPLTLNLSNQEQFSTELLQPSLGALAMYRAGLRSLISHLKEKDSVIQKLQDKIEVSGIDLSAVFPGAGLGKGSFAKKPQRVIPGLAEFNYEDWVSSTPNIEADPFATDTLPHVPDMSVLKTGLVNTEWWDNLPDRDQEVHMIDQTALYDKGTNAESIAKRTIAKASPDGDLQGKSEAKANIGTGGKRAIPERKRSFQKGSQSSTSSEEDTSQFEQMHPQVDNTAVNEEVLDSLRSTSVLGSTEGVGHEQLSMSSLPAKRIGKLGGKKQSPPVPATFEKIPETQNTDKTDSPTTPPKKTSKLGKIGGTTRTRISEREDQVSEIKKEAQIDEDSSLERDGRKKGVGSSDRERETSQERADRRRAELKRQLEEKKRAPSAKKKQRKF